jgi:hypothetical protein
MSVYQLQTVRRFPRNHRIREPYVVEDAAKRVLLRFRMSPPVKRVWYQLRRRNAPEIGYTVPNTHNKSFIEP